MSALTEWLGKGGVPVIQSLAETRAYICQYCPENVEPNWWERIKSTIAVAIKTMLEVKHEMDIAVSNEQALGMCKACGCCCRLLVHAPIEHIAGHVTPEQYFKHPPACWKRKELSRLPHFSTLHE